MHNISSVRKNFKTKTEHVMLSTHAVPSVANSGIFAKRGTQRGNLLSTTLQVGNASTLLARVVIELERVR